ncbi:MAG: M4 family peptidase, partial [Sphingobacteriales bacterium]
IKKQLRKYDAELVIAATNTGAKNKDYALVYKCRVDGRNGEGKVVMMNVFIDAATGRVVKSVSLMAHVDVTGSAHTLYSGTRTITTDSVAEGYRLRDNIRKIETYDVGGIDPADQGNVFFLNPRDYFSASTDWNEQPAVMKMSLTAVTNNMLTGLGFQTGKFVTSLFTQGDFTNAELVSWPDVKISNQSTLTLPLTSSNVYVFPGSASNFIGGWGKLDAFGNNDITDSAFFLASNMSLGLHSWTDVNANAGTYTVSLEKNPALDAHWGMERTHDFYNETFNRNSYDGNGGVVKNYINGMFPLSFTQNNAAALPAPYFSMVYGMGDGTNMSPFVGLDVMGHEFTHMVTESNGHGGLDYEGESGALNESFSDIFGTSIEFFSKGTEANWTIGEDLAIGGGYLRSMSNPKIAQNPDTYEGQYWIDPANTQNDNGGVHNNSSV